MIVLFSTLGLILLPKILLGVGSIGRGLANGVKSMKDMVTSSIDLIKNLAKGNIAGAFAPKPGEKFGALRKKVQARQEGSKLPDTSKVGEGSEKIGKKGLTSGFRDNMTNIAEGFKAMGQAGVGKGIFNTMLAGPALLAAVQSIPFILFMGKTSLPQLIPNFESLALGLSAMRQGSVLKGIGNTLLAGPALAMATLGIPFLLVFGKVSMPQLLPNFENLALGLQSMIPTFVGSKALAAFGLASIVALPSLIFLGVIALLGAAGAAGLIALGGGLESLGLVAATGLPFIAVELIASLGASMIPFAYALNLATPAIEAFGNVMTKVFSGIATVIKSASSGISEIFTTLSNIDATKLLLIGPALLSISAGLATLGAGGVISAIGAFLGGNPIKKLEQLAVSGDGLIKTAAGLQGIASALTQVSSALANINISKLESLKEFTPSNSGLISTLLNPINTVITNLSGKSNSTPQQDNSALLEEMRAMRQEQARSNSKPTIVENSVNGTRFGTAVAMNTYKVQ